MSNNYSLIITCLHFNKNKKNVSKYFDNETTKNNFIISQLISIFVNSI